MVPVGHALSAKNRPTAALPRPAEDTPLGTRAGYDPPADELIYANRHGPSRRKRSRPSPAEEQAEQQRIARRAAARNSRPSSPSSEAGSPDLAGPPAPPEPEYYVRKARTGWPRDKTLEFFRPKTLQIPGCIAMRLPNGRSGAERPVRIVIDTGAQGTVVPQEVLDRLPPDEVNYVEGHTVVRGFMDRDKIRCRRADVVFILGTLRFCRRVFVVPRGVMGPEPDILLGLDAIQAIHGQIDTTLSGWCLRARDSHYREVVVPFRLRTSLGSWSACSDL
eukprot:tig00020849_g14626.t1